MSFSHSAFAAVRTLSGNVKSHVIAQSFCFSIFKFSLRVSSVGTNAPLAVRSGLIVPPVVSYGYFMPNVKELQIISEAKRV